MEYIVSNVLNYVILFFLFHCTIGKVAINIDEKRLPEIKFDFNKLYDVPEMPTAENEIITQSKDTPLILTRYIEEGRLEDARLDSTVDPTEFFQTKSHSGLVTVDSRYDSNTFFWYFPAKEKPVNETPLIIWIEGELGVSSFYGIFNGIGPFLIKQDGKFEVNNSTLLRDHSLLFIDGPVGVGFSYTNYENGYVNNTETYSKHLFETVRQFLIVFPDLKTAPSYIAGSSLGARYAVSLAHQMSKYTDSSALRLNLQGLILGNAVIDPTVLVNKTQSFYYTGLILPEEYQSLNYLQERFLESVSANNATEAAHVVEILDSKLEKHTAHINLLNYLREDMVLPQTQTYENIITAGVRKALHVGDLNHSHFNATVKIYMVPDFLHNEKIHLEELLERYNVLGYCGNLNQIVSCKAQMDFYRTLIWSKRKKSTRVMRNVYYYKNKLNGYYRMLGEGFTEVVVIGAGHIVPVDKPAFIADVITNWTHSLGIGSGISADEIVRLPVYNNKTNQETSPVILTKYIEENKIEEGRNASAVDPEQFLNVKSYSGFFTAKKEDNSNLFFWYFPVENKPVNETPWIIWLQGGPGASSLVGLFDEFGPFYLNKHGKLVRRLNTWHSDHSLVYIDNPVGTGFSFADNVTGLSKTMDDYSQKLYETVRQLVLVFPELKVAPLFIAGESYAGKYVPALGDQIHDHITKGDIEINLQGLILGNSFINPNVMKDFSTSFYQLGLLEPELKSATDIVQIMFERAIDTKQSEIAKELWMSMINSMLLAAEKSQSFNHLKDNLDVGRYAAILKLPEFKKALHVGNLTYDFINYHVNYYLRSEFLTSSQPKIESLLNKYRVLAYCGNLDLSISCYRSSENFRTWNWSHSNKFTEAPKRQFFFNNKLGGFLKSGGGFTEMNILGAGHIAARDKRELVHDVITKFTRNNLVGEPLPT